ncbi:DUF3995 domain-containing protein [Bacillus alkalicellulosilyticus]|uniref:DUF3995 domain-containing protein n=1 Tax=Alkalihalobacterium alkalicellulosilyticum TaxID=1912214 RepID=UPI000996246D|nr:DUF3995 domain-containing protein [Bacillus alkalicellulosilyticus]
MMDVFVWLAILLLVLLSGIHVYWTFGGTWGVNGAVPRKVNSDAPAFVPRKAETIVVALLLLAGAGLLFVQANYTSVMAQNALTQRGSIIVGIVFILRTIGDFKYMGLFKKVKGSTFATNDTLIYNPLCLFLGIIFILV